MRTQVLETFFKLQRTWVLRAFSMLLAKANNSPRASLKQVSRAAGCGFHTSACMLWGVHVKLFQNLQGSGMDDTSNLTLA